VRDALNDLEAKGLIHKVRYAPHIPDPLIAPVLTIYGRNEHNGPVWKWVYRKGPAPLRTEPERVGIEERLAPFNRRLDDATAKLERRGTHRAWRKRERRHLEWIAALDDWRRERGVA
jgi:hypothetical protein